eukprot:scaffold70068_cov39-Phaeocystis_antarctica.AAC.1
MELGETVLIPRSGWQHVRRPICRDGRVVGRALYRRAARSGRSRGKQSANSNSIYGSTTPRPPAPQLLLAGVVKASNRVGAQHHAPREAAQRARQRGAAAARRERGGRAARSKRRLPVNATAGAAWGARLRARAAPRILETRLSLSPCQSRRCHCL